VLARDPNNPDANNLLGMLALDLGFAVDAVAHFEKAIAASPETAPYHLNLGNAQLAAGQNEGANRSYERAIELDARSLAAHFNLGLLKMLEGDEARALSCFRSVQTLEPTHPSAGFLVAALVGEQRTAPPLEYVETLFDTYADRFDNHLEQLAYDIPRELRALVDQVTDTSSARWTVLDIGCGTGMSGAAFRDLAARLVGCDVSARMLERASTRGIYDQLEHGELVEVLSGYGEELDLVVATDVFIYVGDLTAAFAACREALRDNGMLAFSVESAEGEQFTLCRTGRFAHSEPYIRRVGAEQGFEVVATRETTIRTDAGRPIRGRLHVSRAVRRDLG